MTQTIAPRKAGRAYIGPKAQANIPQEQMDWINQEAYLRQIQYADMLREVIAAGIAALRAGA